MDFYLYFIILLFVLGAIDLVVGVSNDAVNFLNSAIGSKVASYRTILLIASIGILLGSVFSEGMMEVAKNGIFQPKYFTFEQVMYLFLAVMLTDIILLDFYNTLGLPTSTTVSLVFELLGSAFAIALMVILTSGSNAVPVSKFINYDSAVVIVGGIFLSVFVSFIFGSLVQYFARILFSFRINKSVKRWGPVLQHAISEYNSTARPLGDRISGDLVGSLAISFQFFPSAERYARTTFPNRSSRSHMGLGASFSLLAGPPPG